MQFTFGMGTKQNIRSDPMFSKSRPLWIDIKFFLFKRGTLWKKIGILQPKDTQVRKFQKEIVLSSILLKKPNKIISPISAQASKTCLYFFIWPLFWYCGRNLKTTQFPSETSWPLDTHTMQMENANKFARTVIPFISFCWIVPHGPVDQVPRSSLCRPHSNCFTLWHLYCQLLNAGVTI